MKGGKKKGIVVLLVIIFILLIGGAVGGWFVYAYTDLFKSNETLFYKYMGQTIENLKFTENKQMIEMEQLTEQMPYTLTGKLAFDAGEANEEPVANLIEQMKITVNEKVDKPKEKAYSNMQLFHNDTSIFTLEYANSNNIYALKSDEIITAYLGIENENLKVLAQKLGITDVESIPNTIQATAVGNSYELSQEEQKHMLDTYFGVLTENIAKDKFTKEANIAVQRDGITYNTTGYRLTLSAEELKQIIIKLLETLKQDSITLNIIATEAKTQGLDENYTEIENLAQTIQDIIDELNAEETVVEDGLTIVVYVDKGQVITTEIIARNEIKATIYEQTKDNTKNRYILLENLSADAEYNKIELQLKETKNERQTTYDLLVNVDNKLGFNLYFDNTGLASEKTYNTTIEASISQDGQTSVLGYEQEMLFSETVEGIPDLNRNNCGVLNDYTTEQLQVLLTSVVQRLSEVIAQKIQLIGGNNINVQDESDSIVARARQAQQIQEEAERYEEESLANVEAWLDDMDM